MNETVLTIGVYRIRISKEEVNLFNLLTAFHLQSEDKYRFAIKIAKIWKRKMQNNDKISSRADGGPRSSPLNISPNLPEVISEVSEP